MRAGRGSHPAPNGTRGIGKPEAGHVAETSGTAPATDAASTGWDTSATQADNTPLDSSWEHITPDSVPSAPADGLKTSSKPDGTRSWASIFAKPKPSPAPPTSQAAQMTEDTNAPIVPDTSEPVSDDIQGLPPPIDQPMEIPNTPPTSDLTVPDLPSITPSGDELTETNLEQLPDTSHPPATVTVASTVASTLDPRSAGTPYQSKQNTRPALGGFATTAWKAAGGGRSTSYQRKIQEQQEAVVMPGKHAVDRATVQFGSMGLNGPPEDVDVDSDREDAETRTQPPQHSPVAPRASLPPAPQQQTLAPQSQSHAQSQPPLEPQATPRQAPGLPPVPGHTSISQQDQPLSAEQSFANPSNYGFNQFNDRFGAQGPPSGISPVAQKPYEPFGQQQASSQSHSDSYPPTSQAQHQQQPGQPSLSSASNDVSSFYTADNQRSPYQNNLYGNFPTGQQSQEATSNQPRTGSAFGSSGPQQSHNVGQGRFHQSNENPTSGNSTPNPGAHSQQQLSQHHQMHQGRPDVSHGGYPYGYPYGGGYYSSYMGHMNQGNSHLYGRDRLPFDDVRRYDDQFLSQNPQYGYGGGQGGYGALLGGGKHSMYGQTHQGYGMSPQSSYDHHSASPANTGAFGSQLPSNRESAAPGNLNNYARSGSTQPSENPSQYSGVGAPGAPGAPGYGNTSDVFGQSRGFQGHNQGVGGNIGQPPSDDTLRGYGESSKGQGGPSPALGQPSGRPGSAATPQGQSGQNPNYAGLSSTQSLNANQYGGVPGHQTGGQNHQGGYGGYGGGYGNYYGNNNRGGWGANYGH